MNEVYISESKGDSFDFDHPDQGYGTYYLSILKVPGMPAELENGSGTLIYGQGSHDRWRQQLLLSQRGEVWYRTEYDRSSEEGNQGVWKAWKRLITNEPPQEFTLSLMEGAAGWLRYSLDQTGFVHMQLYFTSTDGLDTHTLLAILPVGYRPLHAVVCPIVCRKSNGIHSGFLDIRADGSVYADTYGDGGKATYGGASFSFRAVV